MTAEEEAGGVEAAAHLLQHSVSSCQKSGRSPGFSVSLKSIELSNLKALVFVYCNCNALQMIHVTGLADLDAGGFGSIPSLVVLSS